MIGFLVTVTQRNGDVYGPIPGLSLPTTFCISSIEIYSCALRRTLLIRDIRLAAKLQFLTVDMYTETFANHVTNRHSNRRIVRSHARIVAASNLRRIRDWNVFHFLFPPRTVMESPALCANLAPGRFELLFCPLPSPAMGLQTGDIRQCVRPLSICVDKFLFRGQH